MLPCVCSVIDHRWRQNVVRTKKWHTRRSRLCHWCFYHILTSSVIYYWIRRTQHGIYLFYIIMKSLFHFKIFQHNAKAGLLPRLCPAFARKKAIWRDLRSIQNEAISLVAMRSKELCWSRKIAPLSNLTRASLLVEWKVTAKAGNWTAKSTNLEGNAGKIKSVFVFGAASVSRKDVGRCLLKLINISSS